MSKVFKVLTLLLFFYILITLDLKVFIGNFEKINFFIMSVAIMLNIPLLFIKAYRWKIILELQEISIKIKQAFAYYMSALYIGILTPGRLGEFSKIFYIRNYIKKPYGWIFSSVFIDRIFDLYFLVLLSCMGFYIFNFHNVYVMGLIFLVFILFPLLVIKTVLLKNFLDFIIRLVFVKFKENFSFFASSFKASTFKVITPKAIFLGITLTLIAYLIFFLQTYLISLSLDLNINFVDLSLIMAIVNLVALLPISISGLGTREALLLYFFIPLGYSNEITILYSLCVLLVFYVGGGLIGYYYFFKNPINLNILKV